MATIRRRRKGAPSAPAGPADPIEVERRINEVQTLIVCSQWVPGVTPRELAEKWGVEAATIMGYHAEARRSLKREGRQHSHVFEDRLEALITMAVNAEDYKTALAGMDKLRNWQAERRILSGKGVAGTSIADLEASRKAALNNERED